MMPATNFSRTTDPSTEFDNVAIAFRMTLDVSGSSRIKLKHPAILHLAAQNARAAGHVSSESRAPPYDSIKGF